MYLDDAVAAAKAGKTMTCGPLRRAGWVLRTLRDGALIFDDPKTAVFRGAAFTPEMEDAHWEEVPTAEADPIPPTAEADPVPPTAEADPLPIASEEEASASEG